MNDNLTMTLAQIRERRPCENGWKTLLASLGGASTSLATRVSLGDIARSNGPADAWWCVRVLDWSDATVRRRVVSVLLLTVRRAATHTTDERVHACIDAVQRWCDGDNSVDLESAAAEARAAAWAAARATEATTWAARAAEAAAWAAADAAEAAEAAAWAAPWAARVAAAAEAEAAGAAGAAAWAAELEHQRADVIAAFPPLHRYHVAAATSPSSQPGPAITTSMGGGEP